jgi:DNA mismatch repair protein MutL
VSFNSRRGSWRTSLDAPNLRLVARVPRSCFLAAPNRELTIVGSSQWRSLWFNLREMGRIHVLPEHVANQIAAGEVVERPASVVKELLENALDAGAQRIRLQVEAGGKKLIQITDDGCGMVRDDAMLAFERHATSKLKNSSDLLSISTLGFRGEALPSIASVSRLRLETHALEGASGTIIEIAGGKMLRVEEAGLPPGTSITVRDLFFNTPARRKFLRSEATELSHIASLVTHYALAHPGKHFELHSASNALLTAAPVASSADRIYQIFGKDTLEELLPLAAEFPLARSSFASQHSPEEDNEAPPAPGELRLHGFISKPEVQKLNRNSIFVFVNRRLIRDRLIQHALTEAYRNIMPPTVYPVVLLFLEMPYTEVDVNVHPSKVEVRFRQQTLVHDFVRDSVRALLMKARPLPQFTREISAQPRAGAALTPGADFLRAAAQPAPAQPVFQDPGALGITEADIRLVPANPAASDLALQPPLIPAQNQSLRFEGEPIEVAANAAVPAARFPRQTFGGEAVEPASNLPGREDVASALATLQPLGQVRDSFILAVNDEGLWIIDQHVAHERVLFEKVLHQRARERVETQRLLMPIIVGLTPGQQAVFTEISDELGRNGFEVEPFGARTLAIKSAPAGVEAGDLERMLHELLGQLERERQVLNLEIISREIAASIACHAAIKVNTPLALDKMRWLIGELAQTECPMSCPHGRPVVLRYSVAEIQRAFKRI